MRQGLELMSYPPLSTKLECRHQLAHLFLLAMEMDESGENPEQKEADESGEISEQDELPWPPEAEYLCRHHLG